MRGHHIAYSAAELAWIEAHGQRPRREAHAEFRALFGREDVSLSNFSALCKRMGWLTGNTGQFVKGQEPLNKGKPCAPGEGGRHPNARAHQFQKGRLPHNTKHLGHERLSKEGYIEVSIAETNPHTGYERRYVLKHRHLWEKANGPVPTGMVLKCKGDKANCDPSNWELVPRALLPRLNGRFGRGYDSAPPELKPTILAVAKLEHQVREKRSS